MDTGEPIPGIASQEVVKPKPQPNEGASAVGTLATPKVEPAFDVEQIKKELTDPRTISKKYNPEGRKAAAADILQARREGRSTRDTITGKEQEREGIIEQVNESYPQEQQAAKDLAVRWNDRLVKLKGKLGIGDKKASEIEAQLAGIRTKRRSLSDQAWQVAQELEELKQEQAEIPNPKELLKAYYEKMETQPLTNQEKRELLVPEVLAGLSTEEYIALWRRLNPHFLAHVTRQGFRDHNAMIYHSAGLEEFHKGFINVMEDERLLRPPIALAGLKNRDGAAVRQWLSDWVLQAEDQQQAKERLSNLLHFHLASAPKYPDETAVHFAAQKVADGYYGGESGNEAFFIYPSDVLASQHPFAFNGWEKDLTRPQSETKWNDVFIWTDPDHPGVPVDSGIVFLAEKTPVDPETGSKYASEIKVVDGQEKRVMVEDTALISSFVEWGKKLDDQSPLKRVYAAYRQERNYYRKEELSGSCFTAFVQALQSLGFKTDASAALADKLISAMYSVKVFDNETLLGVIRSSNAHWKRAENTIPAKEYWEKFFAQNLHLRPKHIQYYDGDPTTAVLLFQQQNNIGRADTSTVDGQLLGFDDHHVFDMAKDPRANVGYDDLVATADKIIKDHYGASLRSSGQAI